MNGEYDDIIALPRHVSEVHAPMPVRDRAAQFSPFAALTGYEEIIDETGRETTPRRVPDERRKNELDRGMNYLREHISDRPEITLTCFVPDARKSGGSYETICGNLRKIDDYAQKLLFTDGRSINVRDVWELQISTLRDEEN